MRVLGVDLAWGEGTVAQVANETGVAALDASGRVVDAGWTIGLDATVSWILEQAESGDAILFVDAPLVVDNETGQRLCECQVGQRYGKWKVSANSTNLSSKHLGGVALRKQLEAAGWRYDGGSDGPPTGGRVFSECYPYTTLVGAEELDYDFERPVYKRKPKKVPAGEFRPLRAAVCDDLISRLHALKEADPALHLDSHEQTRALVDEPSPLANKDYKHREDLIDALLCAWTASLWLRFGLDRCQVLGATDPPTKDAATILAPCRDSQRAAT